MSQQLPTRSKYDCPRDPSEHVEEGEAPGRDTIDAREHRGKNTEDRDEPSDKDNFATMAQEEILAQIEFSLIQADPMPPFEHDPTSKRAAEPIANIVA